MSLPPIPLVDLAPMHAELRPKLDAAIASVIDSGRFILGPEVQGFEQELAELCQSRSAVGVSSGTDALLVSLMALGVGAGDEVVTTAFSFFATAGVIARLGAKPVFADIEAKSFNLDPSLAVDKIGSKTKALMPVNLYGRLATLPETSLPIIEDAAQSIGCGKRENQKEGIGSCYSFFPTKNVGAFGDAGAVVSDDPDFIDRVRLLRTHGGRPKYFHQVVGGNFRIDAMQAAVLRVKMEKLAEWNSARRLNAQHYRSVFAQSSMPPECSLPEDSPEHSYHQFTVRMPNRDALWAALKEQGIGCEVYYPAPLHLQACFADLGYKPGSLPVTEAAAAESLSLPIHPYLSQDSIERVVGAIEKFYR